jgi:RNA polymerase sigma factor (sigma-70 family)
VEGRPLQNPLQNPWPDDAGLVERARRGDQRAYEELVRKYSEVAFRTALLITGSTADAEEAAQDAFFKAHRALGRFRPGEPFRPWLLTIVGNEARNRVRSSVRREAMTLRMAEAVRTGDAAPSPEAAALAARDREALLAAIRKLSHDDREVIQLRYLLDLAVAETAAALGVAEGTVKSRLSRALERLRAQMRPEGVEVHV